MLNPGTVGLSLAFTAEFLYVVCAFFFFLFPRGTLLFFNTWFHGLDLRKAAGGGIGLLDFMVGFVSIFIVSYVTGRVFAFFYNIQKAR